MTVIEGEETKRRRHAYNLLDKISGKRSLEYHTAKGLLNFLS